MIMQNKCEIPCSVLLCVLVSVAFVYATFAQIVYEQSFIELGTAYVCVYVHTHTESNPHTHTLYLA